MNSTFHPSSRHRPLPTCILPRVVSSSPVGRRAHQRPGAPPQASALPPPSLASAHCPSSRHRPPPSYALPRVVSSSPVVLRANRRPGAHLRGARHNTSHCRRTMVFGSVNLGAGQASLPETNPDGIADSVSKKMKKRSKVWAHFAVQNYDLNHANCNYCDALLACKSASACTASLVNHLKICKNPAHIGSNQTELTYQACDDGNLVVPWQYTDKEVRKAFARMIVVDELPFIFAEKEGFRFFVSKACPRFNVPSRTTMYKDIIALYESEIAMLRKYFIDSRQTVCLTTDTWTSKRQQSYMVLTAHLLCKDQGISFLQGND